MVLSGQTWRKGEARLLQCLMKKVFYVSLMDNVNALTKKANRGYPSD